MSEKTYEVLEPVRIHRRSRDVGALVVAHPDHVTDLVGNGVLREIGNVDDDRSTGDGSQLEANTNPGTAMDAPESGASVGHEDGAQGGEGTAPSVKTAADVSDVPSVTKSTKPAAKSGATKPAAKRGAASKARK
ncbi:hypothetical protein [Burkholderia arboris]|uniref:hypothetical protein n=1 Tax=Burkholderia arboris TaxID=488730 RepID=UPI00210997E5|nr:hypothetical protein [Burkholderia arboris]UTV56166.1 hypothetical protein NLX30_07255 [Burkholderia arboris]